jgi:O-antigen ligase
MLDRYASDIYSEVKSMQKRSQYRDFWSLLLIPFIVGLLTISYFEGLSKIMILYGFVLAGAFSIYFLYHRLRLQPEVIVYFAWVLWSLSGVFVAIDKDLYLEKLLTVIQVSALIFLVSGIVSLKRNISVFMLTIVIGGLIVLLSSFYTGEFLDVAQSETGERAAGFVQNANGFAYNLLFVVYAVFYFWDRKSSLLWRILLTSILAASALGIVYSGSRNGIIGFTAFILLWWYFCHKKKLPKNPLRLFIVLLILLVGISYSANYVLSKTYLGKRIQIQYIEDSSSSQTRFQLYKEGFNMILHNPIFGVGLDNFRVLSTGLYSHSNYIEIASTTGIVGFVIYFTIFPILWRRLNRIRSMYYEPHSSYIIGLLKAAILTMLIQSFATVNYYSKITWVFLAAAIGYSWSEERTLLKLLCLQKEYLRKSE